MRLLPISVAPRPLRAQSLAPSCQNLKRLSSALERFSTTAPPWPDAKAPHGPRWPAARHDHAPWLHSCMALLGSASCRPDSRDLAERAPALTRDEIYGCIRRNKEDAVKESKSGLSLCLYLRASSGKRQGALARPGPEDCRPA